MSKEKIPQNVHIGSYTYNVSPLKALDAHILDVFGLHAPGELQISYVDTLPLQKQAYILTHEVLHGIFHITSMLGEDEHDLEESLVTKLSEEINEFILNNPKFIAWISQTLSNENSRYYLEAVEIKDKKKK